MRLPDNTHRLAVVGRNGTGKTQGAAWVLSRRNFMRRGDIPWLVIDFKRDELLSSIPAEEIELGGKIGKQGIFITHPLPKDETKDQLDEWLWKLWERENVGIFIDEGYMVGNSEALRAVLTQGRSKKLPVILLSQRPAWVSPFAFSEANFFMAFDLHHPNDRKRMAEYVPGYAKTKLPEYHSVYYDVSRNEGTVLMPVPQADEILDDFDFKLGLMKQHRVI